MMSFICSCRNKKEEPSSIVSCGISTRSWPAAYCIALSGLAQQSTDNPTCLRHPRRAFPTPLRDLIDSIYEIPLSIPPSQGVAINPRHFSQETLSCCLTQVVHVYVLCLIFRAVPRCVSHYLLRCALVSQSRCWSCLDCVFVGGIDRVRQLVVDT
jgi:hypothetical protein